MSADAMGNRDRAILIASKVLQKLLERVWMEWSDIYVRAVTRVIDLIIAEAVEQATARIRAELARECRFEQELADLAGPYTGETIRRSSTRRLADTRPLTVEERGLADFHAWRAAREQQRGEGGGQ
jgi:hypothetical protein